MALIGKLLPTQITGDDDGGPVRIETITRRVIRPPDADYQEEWAGATWCWTPRGVRALLCPGMRYKGDGGRGKRQIALFAENWSRKRCVAGR